MPAIAKSHQPFVHEQCQKISRRFKKLGVMLALLVGFPIESLTDGRRSASPDSLLIKYLGAQVNKFSNKPYVSSIVKGKLL